MSIRWSRAARAKLNPRAGKEVTDRDYVAFVRRFSPGKLVALVAAFAGDVAFNQQDYAKHNLITPWGLADVARVSLAFGNEFHRSEPTPDDLLRCLGMYNGLVLPGLPQQDDDPDLTAATMLQLSFSQFPHQLPHSASVGRSIALFDQTPWPDQRAPEVLHSGWQHELLGCSLANYIGVTQLLAATGAPHHGHFNSDWQKDFPQQVRVVLDPVVTRHVLDKFLSLPASKYRDRDPAKASSSERRFTFNPLLEFPLVSGLEQDLLMPVPDFVVWKPTPDGLYFTGLNHWDERFTRDLGTLFEAYVGRQLALIPDVTVYSEITYGPKKSRRQSCDWLVVFPHLVLLVEVKLGHPTQPLRSGSAGAREALRRALDDGHKKLDETWSHVNAQVSGLEQIPVDRPFVGLVITLEDYHVANSPLHRSWFTQAVNLPTRVVSAADLEAIVCLGAKTSSFLAENVTSVPSTTFSAVHQEHAIGDNPLIRAGVEATPLFDLEEWILGPDAPDTR